VYSEHSAPDRVKQATVLLYASVVVGVFHGYLRILQSPAGLSPGVAISAMVIGVVLNVFIIRMIARGRNWARIFTLVVFIVGGLLALFAGSENATENPVVVVVNLAMLVMQAVALILLFQKQSSDWFKRERSPKSA
jgi:hypothetical protein